MKETKLVIMYIENVNESQFRMFAEKLKEVTADLPFSVIITSKLIQFISKEELQKALREALDRIDNIEFYRSIIHHQSSRGPA